MFWAGWANFPNGKVGWSTNIVGLRTEVVELVFRYGYVASVVKSASGCENVHIPLHRGVRCCVFWVGSAPRVGCGQDQITEGIETS